MGFSPMASCIPKGVEMRLGLRSGCFGSWEVSFSLEASEGVEIRFGLKVASKAYRSAC